MSEQELDVGKQRSPTYPYISLDLALERAAKLYEQVRDTPQPREVMAKAYGKPATSSATIQTFATLSQYGLLETVAVNGQRRLRVSQLARSITNPNAPEAIVLKGRQEAALKPTIFRELWDAYQTTLGLNDSVILYYLTVDRQQEHGAVFTERAAQEVLRVYRATVVYAGLHQSDKVVAPADELPPAKAEEEGAGKEQGAERERPPPPAREQVKVMDGERVAFIEEGGPGQYLKLVAAGEIDVSLLEALESYVKRQRKRLGIESSTSQAGKESH